MRHNTTTYCKGNPCKSLQHGRVRVAKGEREGEERNCRRTLDTNDDDAADQLIVDQSIKIDLRGGR